MSIKNLGLRLYAIIIDLFFFNNDVENIFYGSKIKSSVEMPFSVLNR